MAARFATISPHLDERQRRIWVGAEARVRGRGGVSLLARGLGSRGRPFTGLLKSSITLPNLMGECVAQAPVARVCGRKILDWRRPWMRWSTRTAEAIPCHHCAGPARALDSWPWH